MGSPKRRVHAEEIQALGADVAEVDGLAGHPKLVKTVLLRTRTTQTMTETTVLDFKLSNTFEEYRAHMNAPEQQAMFAEMGSRPSLLASARTTPKERQ